MKKDKQKLTKKQVIILTIVTVMLGIIVYFITTEITKTIIDRKTIDEKISNDDFDSLLELETIDNISLSTLIDNYNNSIEDNEYIIDYNNIKDNETYINDYKIKFIVKGGNVSITSISFNDKNKDIKKIIGNMIVANNSEIDQDSVDLIYDKVFDTLGNTSDENSKTSEFFQYSGLEFSLKKYSNSNYKYSFRIGRIVE